VDTEFIVKNVAELVPVFVVFVDDAIFRLIEDAESESDDVVAEGIELEGDDFPYAAPVDLEDGGSGGEIEEFHSVREELDAMRGIVAVPAVGEEPQAPDNGLEIEGKHGLELYDNEEFLRVGKTGSRCLLPPYRMRVKRGKN
jgi:hypothetical protein